MDLAASANGGPGRSTDHPQTQEVVDASVLGVPVPGPYLERLVLSVKAPPSSLDPRENICTLPMSRINSDGASMVECGPFRSFSRASLGGLSTTSDDLHRGVAVETPTSGLHAFEAHAELVKCPAPQRLRSTSLLAAPSASAPGDRLLF